MDGLGKNNSVDIIKEEPKDVNIFAKEANRKVEEDNNVITFLKSEDMKNEDKELRETGSTLEMLGQQPAIDETMIEKGITKTEDPSIMDYEEGINHVVPFRQNKKSYPCIETVVEEIKENFECEPNEDVLQENKSAACEDIIEMKNNDTNNEEEMKTVIMIVDDEDEENTALSTLNSSTEKLENKEIKNESISNYDSCNAAVEEIKENFECEPNEDVLQENKSAACEDVIEMKNNDTNNEEEIKAVIMISDDEDEENTALSTLNSSTEKLENKEIKKKSVSNYDSCNAAGTETSPFEGIRYEPGHCRKIDFIRINFLKTLQEYHNLQKPKPNNTNRKRKATLNSSTEKLENKEIKKKSISNYDSCNAAGTETSPFEGIRYEPGHCRKIDFIRINFLKTLQEYHNLQKPKPNNTNRKRKATLNSSTEKLENKEIKKKSISNYDSCNATGTETSPFEGIRYEPGHCRKIDFIRINFLKTLQEYHNLQTPKPNNTNTKRKVWSDLCCPLSKQSYKHLKSLETHMKGHGKWNLKEEKVDEEKIPLSTPKPFFTERLQKNETKTDKEDEEKIPLSTLNSSTEILENKEIKNENISNYDYCNVAVEEIKENFECEANEDVLQENESAVCEDIIEMKNDDTDNEEEMKAVIMIVDDEDEENIPLSTLNSSTEKLENKEIKKENISNYDYCNVAVEEIKENFECEANEDVLQENESAVCEDIIEMKNDDTDNEEEMKAVIMIVDDEDEENIPLSTLNSSTEKLANKEIKNESISNYDSCNAAVEEIKENFECEANEDVLQENKSAVCEDIIEMKNNDTDNEEEMKAVIMIVDDEDEENIPLSTLNSSTEILENKEIKKESISNYDYCNVAVEEIKENFECGANEDVLQENESAVCEDIIEMKNDDTDNEEMKTVIMISDDEDEENTALSTLNSSTEKLENKEIKKKSVSNYDSCNAAGTETSPFERIRYEPGHCRKIDFRRINFLKTLQEYHNLQTPKPNNTNTKRKVWSDLCCPLCKQSYKHLKSLETHLKGHGKRNLQEEKVDEEKISLPKPFSTERLENKDIKEDKMSIDIPTRFERVHNETGLCPEVDRRINFLESLKNYHNSNKPKTNDPEIRTKIWSGFCCVSCKRSYKNPKSLGNHIRNHGKLVIFKIEPDGDLTLKSPKSTCFGKYFKTKEEADKHYNRSLDSEINKCPSCYKNYTDSDKLEAHKRYAHKQNIQIPTEMNDEKFFFSVYKKCGNTFPNETAVSDHEKSGCATSPIFKCDECGKILRHFSSFKRHRTVHTGELPHLCNFCGKAFRAYKIARRHEREHCKEELFKCSICSFAFADKKSLITHFALHTA